MSDDCLCKECAICGEIIHGANHHCPNCKLCLCFNCGLKLVLSERATPPTSVSCGSKLK